MTYDAIPVEVFEYFHNVAIAVTKRGQKMLGVLFIRGSIGSTTIDVSYPTWAHRHMPGFIYGRFMPFGSTHPTTFTISKSEIVKVGADGSLDRQQTSYRFDRRDRSIARSITMWHRNADGSWDIPELDIPTALQIHPSTPGWKEIVDLEKAAEIPSFEELRELSDLIRTAQ